MQTTITPTAEHSITIARRAAQHLHRQARYPVGLAKAPAIEATRPEGARASVVEAFRKMAHGTGPATAERQTKAFYQSGGQGWSRALTGMSSHAAKSHVVNAFRAMAHGVRDTSAHASTLRFYRSGGQTWAQNLGC